MECIYCNSEKIYRNGNYKGKQRYKCNNCGRYFTKGERENKYEYIIHFNSKLRKTPNNKLTRDNYCIPTNELDYQDKRNIQIATEFYKRAKKEPIFVPKRFYIIPNEIYADYEHYTDEYVKLHYERCMENYDLNIKFFSNINHNDFDECLLKFVKKNRFKEVFDLNIVKGISGIYILVLDNYNQVYIGKSEDIKKRILNHWSKRKAFGRLINGSVDTSILSIDSFGALDTTRIYYKEVNGFLAIDEEEKKLVNNFKKEYRLNRVAGGINGEENSSLRNLMLLSSTQERKLK